MLRKVFRRRMDAAVIALALMGLLVTSAWSGFLPLGGDLQQAESPSEDNYIYLPMIAKNAMSGPQPAGCLSSEEALLATLVNNYRNNNGLPDAPVSKSLVSVAQWHVLDLELNHPDSGVDPRGLPCNMHSWSNWRPTLWSAVCYTSDHYYASGVWIKPSEITGNIYNAYGYENSYWSSAGATASGALNAWKGSPGHNDLILEQGIWAGPHWPAMGVGIHEHYAVLWFGDIADPQGTVGACPP